MKKWIKITGITAAVCIGAGLICFVSGVFAGAKSGVFISRRGIELEGSAYSVSAMAFHKSKTSRLKRMMPKLK